MSPFLGGLNGFVYRRLRSKSAELERRIGYLFAILFSFSYFCACEIVFSKMISERYGGKTVLMKKRENILASSHQSHPRKSGNRNWGVGNWSWIMISFSDET
jgi:hypothetical protein